MDFRNDSVGGPLGLYHTRATERIATIRADDVDQQSVGVFGDSEIEWSRKVRTTFGLRGDIYHWNVTSDNPLNSGDETLGDSESESVGGVRSVAEHRVLCQLGTRASIRTPAWASSCRSIR